MHTRKAHHMASVIPELRTKLPQLVGDIREIVAKELDSAQTSAAVAEVLGPYLDSADLLTEADRAASEEHYQQHVLHVEPDGSFSIVSLVWLPGQRTPIHDHVSWCVVGVYEGEEAEVRYRLDGTGEDRHLVATGTGINPHGSTCGFAPPGDLHEVANAGNSKAISIHVYGADIRRLGSSIRRQYDFPVTSA
jgi:predicted metal-dependent enzyme (double-stranded beta helix superfamily)